MGVSRLLPEVATIARRLGIRVGRSAADPSGTMVEPAALLAALLDGVEPLLDPGQLSSLLGATWDGRRVRSHLRHVFTKLGINSRVELADSRATTRWLVRAMPRATAP
jgi:hypothetical protein